MRTPTWPRLRRSSSATSSPTSPSSMTALTGSRPSTVAIPSSSVMPSSRSSSGVPPSMSVRPPLLSRTSQPSATAPESPASPPCAPAQSLPPVISSHPRSCLFAIAHNAWFCPRFDQTMGAESTYRSNGSHLAPLLFDPCATPTALRFTGLSSSTSAVSPPSPSPAPSSTDQSFSSHLELLSPCLLSSLASSIFSVNSTASVVSRSPPLGHPLPDLCSAAISDVIPFSLGHAAGLSVLSLARNSLIGDIPATLNGLRCLTYLNLSRNTLNESVPPVLATLSNLSLLDHSIFSHPKLLVVATCPDAVARRHRWIRRSPWVGTGKRRKET